MWLISASVPVCLETTGSLLCAQQIPPHAEKSLRVYSKNTWVGVLSDKHLSMPLPVLSPLC